ncbi:MAG: epoxyqueuosine reductase QueH [Candidatus Methanoperedens sp.]|nr:epoxyqueuosine reductase QueH [Candidatus Methanoperedens sp.]MCE8426974.1 epoxyqueuosine reductase QueH [Candidatus Methanoperedens sp.]
MRILVHICCGPCFTYPDKRLVEDGHDVTGFFYNPNIHPYSEFKNRKTSLEKYAKIRGAQIIYRNDYELERYLRGSLEAKDRCRFCYAERLRETAIAASSLGFDAFTSTLLISPYQKHEMLAAVGKEMADKYRIDFYYEDFRKGYKESRDLSRDLELYMQKYCGCIFSEKERYFKHPPVPVPL